MEVEDLSGVFFCEKRIYNQPYVQLYYQRLSKLRGLIEVSAKEGLSGVYDVKVLSELRELKDNGETCVAIGIVYKDMCLKPNILHEYLEDTEKVDRGLKSYLSDADTLYLEDTTQRVQIVGDKNEIARLVSGLIIGVKGQMSSKGFNMDSVIFPYFPKDIKLPTMNGIDIPKKYIAFLSGLKSTHKRTDTNLILLRDFLCGINEENLAKQIGHIIISGNSVSDSLDSLYVELANFYRIDLMPGDDDHTSLCLPQYPMHPAFFPLSCKYKNFRSVSNPYSFGVSGIRVTGCSGQAVSDICKYSSCTELQALEMILHSRCLLPTAPDTLPCYSYNTDDPFALDDKNFPHVCFSANSTKKFHKKHLSNTSPAPLIISIPSFDSHPQLVLLDLTNLSTRIVSFS